MMRSVGALNEFVPCLYQPLQAWMQKGVIQLTAFVPVAPLGLETPEKNFDQGTGPRAPALSHRQADRHAATFHQTPGHLRCPGGKRSGAPPGGETRRLDTYQLSKGMGEFGVSFGYARVYAHLSLSLSLSLSMYIYLFTHLSVWLEIGVCRGPPLCYKLLSQALCYKPLSRASV